MPSKPKFRGKFLHWVRTSVWVFPAALLVLLVILTSFKISGSSVGFYHQIVYGKGSNDSNLLYGHPRAIRSDEWLGMTQFIQAQSKDGLPRFNTNIGSGRDLSLLAEVPYKDWSAVFKPQNLSFFVMPVEFAFAFKWWLLMYLLIVSCYFFVLRILPKKKLFAILLSIAVGLSPFVLWWYQTAVLATLAYGFFMIILSLRIIDNEPLPFIKNQRVANGLYVAALAYIGACFGLIIYPPFQISVALGVAAFVVGYLIQKYVDKSLSLKQIGKRLLLFLIAIAIAGAIGGLFIVTRHSLITTFSNTVYPGSRTVKSGDLYLLNVFDAYLMPVIQSDFRGAHFFVNQSEASNFILVMPFLLLPGFALIAQEFRKKRRIDWVFVAIQACLTLFLLRAFVPHGNTLYKLLLLQKVPNVRLVIGMGFLGVIQFVYIAKKIGETGISKKQLRILSMLYGLTCFVVLLWASSYVIQHYPLTLHSYLIAGSLALVFTTIIVLLLANRILASVVLLLLFTLASSFRIMPLYRGFGFIKNSELITKMESVSKPGDAWGTVDNIYYEDFGLLAGRRSITGTQIYPDMGFWRQIGGGQYDNIYNREAHALFTTDPTLTAPLRLPQKNVIQIKLECNEFLKNNVQFLLAVSPINLECVRQVDQVSYPQVTFYLYSVNN